MEVIYQKACGIDVHKSFIVAVICDSTSAKPQYLRKRFSTFNNSLIEFRNWLLANDCQNVCMEPTGKYYIPVYNALEGHMNVIQEHIDYLNKSIKTLKEIIDSIVKPYESAINLLCSIPGVDRKSAITIIS